VAVLRLQQGSFGFVDTFDARMDGAGKLVCELTVRDGRVLYDLNGITRERWEKLPKGYGAQGDWRWDGYRSRPRPQSPPKEEK
jgi:dihydroorotase